MAMYMRAMLDIWLSKYGKSFGHNQSGATLVEYALIIAAVAVVVLLGGAVFTDGLENFFTFLNNELNKARQT